MAEERGPDEKVEETRERLLDAPPGQSVRTGVRRRPAVRHRRRLADMPHPRRVLYFPVQGGSRRGGHAPSAWPRAAATCRTGGGPCPGERRPSTGSGPPSKSTCSWCWSRGLHLGQHPHLGQVPTSAGPARGRPAAYGNVWRPCWKRPGRRRARPDLDLSVIRMLILGASTGRPSGAARLLPDRRRGAGRPRP